MSDEHHRALLRQVAARDARSAAAMAELYKALCGAVFGFVRQRLYTADDHAVQEVVVDTMHEVWKAAERFGAQSAVKTWVLGIARHKLLDSLRAQGAHAGAHDDIDDHAETLADDSPDLCERLAEQQRAQWLKWCMDKLPEDQRESLHLLFVEGQSVEQIAQVQGIPGGTVKTRVFHAKRKLKECLSRWLRHESAGSAGLAGA